MRSIGAILVGLLAGLWSIGCSPEPDPAPLEAPAARPNIVLVVADTLRADRFNSGGVVHPMSMFDRIRSQGTYFTNAYATTSWTIPSTVSIFLSKYPSEHGSTHWVSPLGNSGISFVEGLKGVGYRTGGWSSNFLITEERGFQRGFDTFKLVKHPEQKFGMPSANPSAFALADDLLSDAIPWLDGLSTSPNEAPFFLYFHWMEAHTPYLCPTLSGKACETSSTRVNRKLMTTQWGGFSETEKSLVRKMYDADTHRIEVALRQLVIALRERGLLEDTWLIVTADHGEMLGEHGLYVHGNALHQEALRIPLLIRPPEAEPSQEIDALVSLIDIAPTILAIAGVDTPDSFRGRSLLPAMNGKTLPPRPVVAELLPMRKDMGPLYRHVLALIDGSSKYLVGPDGRAQRFDLSKDPQEQTPLPASLSDLQQGLASAGVSFQHLDALEGPNLHLSPKAADELRALGYLQD